MLTNFPHIFISFFEIAAHERSFPVPTYPGSRTRHCRTLLVKCIVNYHLQTGPNVRVIAAPLDRHFAEPIIDAANCARAISRPCPSIVN